MALLLNFDLPRIYMPLLKFWEYCTDINYDVQGTVHVGTLQGKCFGPEWCWLPTWKLKLCLCSTYCVCLHDTLSPCSLYTLKVRIISSMTSLGMKQQWTKWVMSVTRSILERSTATRSTLMRSTYHEINTHKIKLSRDQLVMRSTQFFVLWDKIMGQTPKSFGHAEVFFN